MRSQTRSILIIGAALTVSACQADSETLDAGATLDAPADVENAPLITDLDGERLDANTPPDVVAEDTLQQIEIEADTAT